MAAICGSSILACGMRATLLDSTGNVANEENNYWVTNNMTEITIAPTLAEGAAPLLRSGCACVIGTAKFPDLLQRFAISINMGTLEAGMVALMTGASPILVATDPVGFDWPTNLLCTDDPPPLIALEVWSWNWEVDHQSDALPYWHWVWPAGQYQFGNFALNQDFSPFPLNGNTRGNNQWGDGPFADGPPDGPVGQLGSVWQTADAPPAATCGYGTVTPSS